MNLQRLNCLLARAYCHLRTNSWRNNRSYKSKVVVNVMCAIRITFNALRKNIGFKLCLAVFLAQPLSANAADPDWPCIQAFVPVVELGVLWPQVVPEADLGQWKSDERIAPLAKKLGNLAQYTDDDRKLVEQFIESTPAAEQVSTLNRLAEGSLAVANKRRALYIKGIRKYTRQQSAIAAQIEEGLNKLAQLEQDNVQSAERDELRETMDWHQRVFDQREHSMIALCDQPVLVEQTTSDVLRDLAQYLP